MVRQIITEAALSVESKHQGYVDRDDLIQEGYLYLLEHQSLIDDLRDESKKSRNTMAKSLRWAMDRYGMSQRLKADGTRADDYFRYTAGMVEELLADALEGLAAMPSPSALDEATASSKPANESGDRMAMMADIQQAFDRMSENDQELLLELYYGGSIDYEVLALTKGVTADAIRKREQRALLRLARVLNGDYSPKRKRRVVSNSTAQVWTKKWVDGE